MGHLLVIDDSPTIRKLVELTFRSSTWTLDFASSGRQGIALAKQCAPDVILLDFVLPDMRGLEVCARLAADAVTQGIPVILMSAKDESVRQLFKAYPAVVDFVPKPFTAEELASRVRTAAADDTGMPRRSVRPPSRFSRAQREQAVKTIYGKLSKSLASIPSFFVHMGTQNPAAYFGRKLLVPEVVSDLLEALVPLYREVLGAAPQAAPGLDTGSPLSGQLAGWPLADICTFFGASGRTGELELRSGGATVLVYYRCGEIVLVTSREPQDHVRVEGGSLAGVAAEAVALAEAEQRASGKPVHVTLAERGALPAQCDLRNVLHRAGRRLLLDALDAREQSFAWRELAALPVYVDAYARYVPMSRNTQPFGSQAPADAHDVPVPSLKQLALERARGAEATDAERGPRTCVVFDRVSGFSERIREVTLDARERRVLALIDGRYTLDEIATRAGLDAAMVDRIVRCLEDIELVRAVAPSRERPVLICDSEPDGFSPALESLLKERAAPIAVLSVPHTSDVLGAALREHPRAVFLSVAHAADARATVRTLRSHEELRGVSLVALLELPAASQAPELHAAGFDAVLVKPVAYADIERWIAA